MSPFLKKIKFKGFKMKQKKYGKGKKHAVREKY